MLLSKSKEVLVKPGAGFVVENACGEWIAEDRSAVQRLMDRTVGRRSARGMTGLSGLHLLSSDRLVADGFDPVAP